MAGGGGFSRRFDTRIYIWKEASTEPGIPRASPLPSRRCLHPPLIVPAGEKGVIIVAGLGERFGKGEKEIFIFEPLFLFCLRLKKGKIKCVFCLRLWGVPGKDSEAC